MLLLENFCGSNRHVGSDRDNRQFVRRRNRMAVFVVEMTGRLPGSPDRNPAFGLISICQNISP
jgi:hypothetical protein